MTDPQQNDWPPTRIAGWSIAAVLVLLWQGSNWLAAFKPPPDRLFDFIQEWLSARNYWAGEPVYSPQVESLFRHTGRVAQRNDMLAWNAHPPVAVLLALPFGKMSYEQASMLWTSLMLVFFFMGLLLAIRARGGLSSPFALLPLFTGLVICFPLLSQVGSSRVDLQACKLEYSIVSPK